MNVTQAVDILIKLALDCGDIVSVAQAEEYIRALYNGATPPQLGVRPLRTIDALYFLRHASAREVDAAVRVVDRDRTE